MKTKVTMPKSSKVTIKLTIEEAHDLANAIKEVDNDICANLFTDITAEIGEKQ